MMLMVYEFNVKFGLGMKQNYFDKSLDFGQLCKIVM